MMTTKNIYKSALAGLVAVFTFASCQNMEHPTLPANYPKDSNPPGGPLKFYSAFESTNVDSTKANFGTDNNVTYTTGVNGKAIQFDAAKKGFVQYASANSFASSTSFTISLWMNAGTTTLKDHVNADGIFALAKTSDFWGNFTLFTDHETSKSDSMILKAVVAGNWVTYEGAKGRIPHMYDGNWHHLVFSYDLPTTTYTFYLDGKQYDQRKVTGVAFKDASALVLGGFQQHAGINGTLAENTWMASFPGKLDQFRLYSKTLSAAEVADLFAKKQ